MARLRPRRRQNKRWGWIISGVLLILVLLSGVIVYFLNSVNREEAAREAAAIHKANETIQLVEIDKVDKFIWFDTTYVVTGKDAAGVSRMVWVGKDKVTVKKSSDGVTRESIVAQLKSSYPDADIQTIIPGIKDNVLVYQAFVVREDPEGIERHYYHFFRFDNGQPYGEAYPLPIQ